MWIKKDKYDALIKRIDNLERELKRLTTFTVWGYPYPYKYHDITIAEAINKVLDHFGIAFKYADGRAPYAEIVERNNPDDK